MTDYQFKAIIKLVLHAIDSSENIEDAKAKLRELLPKDEKGDGEE